MVPGSAIVIQRFGEEPTHSSDHVSWAVECAIEANDSAHTPLPAGHVQDEYRICIIVPYSPLCRVVMGHIRAAICICHLPLAANLHHQGPSSWYRRLHGRPGLLGDEAS